MTLGGKVINFSTCNGAPNVSDLVEGRRYGDYDLLCKLIRLNNALGAAISPAERWWSRWTSLSISARCG